MALDIQPDLRAQVLARVLRGELILAVKDLMGTGVGLVEAKTWIDELSSSADQLEAAIGQQRELAARSESEAAQAASEAASAREDERLAIALKFDFPAGALDTALELLFHGGHAQQLALTRAAHLCRLANSFASACRKGELAPADALAILRSGAPGFSEASYARAWENGLKLAGE